MNVLVLGASTRADRYSNLAMNMLLDYDHNVVAVGQREGVVRNIQILTGSPTVDAIDTITLYVGPARQEPLYDYVLSLNPRRIIFNPGTENPEFAKKCNKAGIETVEACTLVLLRTNQF